MRIFALLLTLAFSSLAAAATAGGTLVSEHWYTTTLGKGVHYGYYNERLEKRDGKLFFLNQSWKKEQDFIIEEQAGAVATPPPQFGQQFFNFHSTYRSTETTIDGSVKDGMLTVKVRRGKSEDAAPLKKAMPRSAFFSIFFPVWIGMELPKLKEGQSIGYLTILEDNIDAGFSAMNGQVRLEKPDAFALKTKTRKLTVSNPGLKSTWWVDAQGSAVRIENPAQKSVIERVSEEQAKKFLQEGND